MAVVNRKYRYLFLSEAYCASRAVDQALLQHEGSVLLDCWTHEPFDKLCDLGFISPHESLLKFSVVRHPADYLVTKYHHLTSWHKQGFRAFLLYELIKSNTLFAHANDTDKTIRYELLQSQLNDVLETRGAPPVALNVVGQTQGKRAWQTYYKGKDRRLLQQLLADYATYGYRI
jgi:hypothetical protein